MLNGQPAASDNRLTAENFRIIGDSFQHFFHPYTPPINTCSPLNPIPSENLVLKMVSHPDRAVRSGFLLCLPAGGGVYRDQTLLKGKTGHQPAGPEIALDEDVVPRCGLLLQPVPDGLEIIPDSRPIGGDIAPKILKIRRQGNNPLHPQGTPGVGLLVGSELVVE